MSEEHEKIEVSQAANPSQLRWVSLLCSGLTVVGVAWAAAYASTHATEKGIGITAWIAVAVIGTSAMIATARNPKSTDQ